MNYQEILGLGANPSERDIKRAYSKLIKEFRPDTHPIEFSNIREAYEFALREASYRAQFSEQDQTTGPVLENGIVQAPPESAQSDQEQHQEFNTIDAETIDEANVVDTHPNPKENLQPENSEQSDQLLKTEPSQHSAKNQVLNFIYQLDFFAKTQDEQSAEKATQQFLNDLIYTALDEQIAIEETCLHWFLKTESPLILSFMLLDNRFAWTRNLINMARQYGDWAAYRLNALRQLAELKRLEQKELESEASQSLLAKLGRFLMTTAQYETRKSLAKLWGEICTQYGFEELKNRPIKLKSDRWVVLGADIVLACMFGLFAGLFAKLTLDTNAQALTNFGVYFVGTLVFKKLFENILAALYEKLLMVGRLINVGFEKYKFYFEKVSNQRKWIGNAIWALIVLGMLGVFVMKQFDSDIGLSLLMGVVYIIVTVVLLSILVYALLGGALAFLGVLCFAVSLPYQLSQKLEIWFVNNIQASKKLLADFSLEYNGLLNKLGVENRSSTIVKLVHLFCSPLLFMAFILKTIAINMVRKPRIIFKPMNILAVFLMIKFIHLILTING